MSAAVRFWRRGVWISLLVLVGALLSLAPYLSSSTEMVRMRNALVLVAGNEGDLAWTPANVPADFLLERGAPYPEFVDAVSRLGLDGMPSDWERAVAISQHLLGSSPVLLGGAIQSDLLDSYRRIVGTGEGYCGDFARVFSGLALAAGIPVRSWAFSFDGFGGHGHVWVEVWNRDIGRWQLLDVFENNYFVGVDGVPMSALEVHASMRANATTVRLLPLHPTARSGAATPERAWEYYRRGLDEWYAVWGNNVFSYDQAQLVRTFGSVSRALEQLGGIVQGVYPGVRILEEPNNRRQVEAIQSVRSHLLWVGATGAAALLVLLVCLVAWWTAGRRLAARGAR
ncbi:transglutaminase-like domain-containing protein [Accumulibacter sp.]|uniref:Transglutaminase domain protein n=1 Tax=Accumulibacter regalis TaxID=522306 RepID=C7RT12_ACCRE|nr:transglutaminase-like domain-containing protein [Accumulibacter sp.]